MPLHILVHGLIVRLCRSEHSVGLFDSVGHTGKLFEHGFFLLEVCAPHHHKAVGTVERLLIVVVDFLPKVEANPTVDVGTDREHPIARSVFVLPLFVGLVSIYFGSIPLVVFFPLKVGLVVLRLPICVVWEAVRVRLILGAHRILGNILRPLEETPNILFLADVHAVLPFGCQVTVTPVEGNEHKRFTIPIVGVFRALIVPDFDLASFFLELVNCSHSPPSLLNRSSEVR